MKPLSLLGLAAVVLTACTPARPVTTPTPAPVPAEVPAPIREPEVAPAPAPAATPARPALTEAPRNWHLLDPDADGVYGISALRAERELLAGRTPARTVVVAILDSGVDTAHVDLAANLWRNPNERPGTGRDDDGNGYVDDIRGWNFIGGSDGRNVKYDTYEVARLHRRCAQLAPSTLIAAGRDSLPCSRIASDLAEKRVEAEQTLQQIARLDEIMKTIVPVLQQAVGSDSLTVGRVSLLTPGRPDVQAAQRMYLQLASSGIDADVLVEAKAEFESQLEYKLNPDFEPRPIVGDDFANPRERVYGNRDVMGPYSEHGTHVAGIIGAVRGNGTGMDGIAPAVRIMSVRTVPDGDERDKDIANAIRYAVDNGAHIINMSFGKAYSPDKAIVDEAVRYADSRGVLMVHAAGNDGEDLATGRAYPTPEYLDGGRAQNWIGVGASSWGGVDSLAASFSNFGGNRVDVFAPGVDIYSTIPGDKYEANSGTSMAAPVVSGVAAMLMAYYPQLTAADVKRIILESATRRGDLMVARPGDGQRIRFGALSATGGIVNAYEAIRMAGEMTGGR
jgi:subtilisin family serine protease